MSDSTPHQHARVVQQAHRRLQLLVREVGVLCRRSLADDQFYPAYLQRIVAALAAGGASIWLADAAGQMQCRWQFAAPNFNEPTAAPAARRQAWAQRALLSRDGRVFRGGVYMPLNRDGQTLGVIEVLKPATSDVAAARKWLRFVQHMALLAAERPRHSLARAAGSDAANGSQVLSIVKTFHDSLGLDETAYAIVNELRRHLDAERVSLVRLRHGRAQLLAISGQDSFNRRATAVRQLEALAMQFANSTEPQWFPRNRETLPEAEQLSNWQTFGVAPLLLPPASEPAAIVIVEHAAASAVAEALSGRVAVLLPHIQRALANAMQHSCVPWASLWASGQRWLNSGAGVWKRRGLVLLAAIAVIAFLATFPVRFQIHGRGVLQPSRQRDVFADVAGVVRQVHVEHGDVVQAGDVLAELYNSDLEVTIAELQGQQRAAREQLAAIHRQRHDPRTPRGDHDRLAGEMLRLQEQLASLDEQLALLHAKRERLVIRSPIDGQIVTWNVARQLNQRPVTFGQVLMTVADPRSPWELELYLPESDVGHLASPTTTREISTVEYVAVTEPTHEYRGTLRHLDARAQSHDEHGHSVRAVVAVDAQRPPPAPVGTSVTARIDCGRRPIGYVWLHRLLGFVYTKILFRVM